MPNHATPIEQRIREGNPAKRPLPEVVMIAGRMDAPPPPPEHLSEDAKFAWNTFVPPLFNCGMLDRVDTIALELMCVHYGNARQAMKIVAIQGPLTRGSVGQLREHPSMATARKESAMARSYFLEFGGTPSARAHLGLTELHRRTLADELDSSLGGPVLTAVE